MALVAVFLFFGDGRVAVLLVWLLNQPDDVMNGCVGDEDVLRKRLSWVGRELVKMVKTRERSFFGFFCLSRVFLAFWLLGRSLAFWLLLRVSLAYLGVVMLMVIR